MGGRLHERLWWLVCERCQVVDQLVKTRLSHLRHANLSALQLGVPPNYYTPLPAAVSIKQGHHRQSDKCRHEYI